MLAFLAALVPLIPSIAGLFGDKAEKVAERIVPAVQALTGTTEPAAAVEALKANPALLLDSQRLATEAMLAVEREETERLRAINTTIQADATNADAFVRRMRPFFGYVMALSWGAQMLAASYTIVTDPAKAAGVLEGIAATTMLWGIGLAVLGVYVWKRSDEKGAGGPMDVLTSIAGKRK